jgi:hypothetical protein
VRPVTTPETPSSSPNDDEASAAVKAEADDPSAAQSVPNQATDARDQDADPPDPTPSDNADLDAVAEPEPGAAGAQAAHPRSRPAVALVLGLAVGLLAGAAFWAVGPTRGGRAAVAAPVAASPTSVALPGACVWYPHASNTAGSNSLPGFAVSSGQVDPGRAIAPVGSPPPGERRSGTATMTVIMGKGTLTITMDAGRTPCGIASLANLAAKHFYAGDTCAATDGRGLVCGRRDPDYTWAAESNNLYPWQVVATTLNINVGNNVTCADNISEKDCKAALSHLPTQAFPTSYPVTVETVTYPKGTVLLDDFRAGGSGGDFVICTQDYITGGQVTAVGTVTSGLDQLTGLAANAVVPLTDVTVTYH